MVYLSEFFATFRWLLFSCLSLFLIVFSNWSFFLFSVSSGESCFFWHRGIHIMEGIHTLVKCEILVFMNSFVRRIQRCDLSMICWTFKSFLILRSHRASASYVYLCYRMRFHLRCRFIKSRILSSCWIWLSRRCDWIVPVFCLLFAKLCCFFRSQ